MRSEHSKHSAVDINDLSVDVIRSVRGEKNRRADQLLGLAPTTRGRAPFDPGVEARVLEKRLVHLGDHVAWADRVRLDAVLRPLGRHRAGQKLETSFGRGVWRYRSPRNFAREGADVDDLASGSAADHASGDLAADEKGARQVGVDDSPPLDGGQIDQRFAQLDPRIVDEDVNGNTRTVEFRESLADRVLVG